jgi:hypothetical protein
MHDDMRRVNNPVYRAAGRLTLIELYLERSSTPKDARYSRA